MKTTDWMQLISGRPFWPLEPNIEDIDIRDIAWALSMQCRYAGHVRRFYSVAEHCVHISYAIPHEYALWGLLHDATEAYLVDLPRPVKRSMPEYRQAEDYLMNCIVERFGLSSVAMPDAVEEADRRILFNERDALLNRPWIPWSYELPPLAGVTIQCWSTDEACARFLARFEELAVQR